MQTHTPSGEALYQRSEVVNPFKQDLHMQDIRKCIPRVFTYRNQAVKSMLSVNGYNADCKTYMMYSINTVFFQTLHMSVLLSDRLC